MDKSLSVLTLDLFVQPTEPDKDKPNWKQVFNVKPVDFHSKQSDFVVHTCKRAGNIIMPQKDVMPVIKSFRNQLQLKENTR